MISICVPGRVLEVDDGFVFGQRQLVWCDPSQPCRRPSLFWCWWTCWRHGGLCLCLHVLVSAGFTGVETSDLCALLVVAVVEGQPLVSLP